MPTLRWWAWVVTSRSFDANLSAEGTSKPAIMRSVVVLPHAGRE